MMLVWFRVCILVSFSFISEYGAVAFSSANFILKALLDSFIHFVTGSLCWFVIYEQPLLELLLCGILSSVIDIDHFVKAQSLSLKAALSLPQRPVFHAVIAIPLVAAITYIATRILAKSFSNCWLFNEKNWCRSILFNLPYLIIVAWGSHQLRDSLRRGLWFWPFGSLSKTPYTLYLFLLAGFPLVIHSILSLKFLHLLKDNKRIFEVSIQNNKVKPEIIV